MEIRDDVREGFEKKLRKEPTCVFSDEIKIYKKMKVLTIIVKVIMSTDWLPLIYIKVDCIFT